jgi:hypothetical protein
MSIDGSYDMVLLPPPRDNDNGGRQPAHRRRNRRRLPRMVEEQHPSLSRHLPRRRRRRRGNHGQAGGDTSSAVERVDDVGAPAGDTSGVDLASETKTSVVSPQHANPKRTDDASMLAKDLLGVSLVPKITVQSISDATPSPSVDQEVPSVFHPLPFRFSFDPSSDPALVDAFIKVYPNLPRYHMWSTWDRLTALSTFGPPGSEEDDEQSLSLSHANACKPLLQAHLPWAQDNTSRGSPYCSSPLCSVSSRPIWAGTRSDNLLVGPGTPRVETPTLCYMFTRRFKKSNCIIMNL